MTTFLLHGGATSKDLPGNKKFFAQFTQLVNKSQVKILLCYWAREKNNWQKVAERDIRKILANTDKKVEFHLVEDVADLLAKIDDYDVLYVAGGQAELLEPYYQKLVPLKDKLKNKVFIGSSMGAFMAAKSYVISYDGDGRVKHEGLGFLPFQVLCHWDLENKKEFKLNLLAEADNHRPILTLNEGEFVTIYQ